MIAAGTRFGNVVVIEEISGGKAGHPCGGSWCRIRCDCGLRKTVRSRHLRGRLRFRVLTCGRVRICPFARSRMLAALALANRCRLDRALLSGKQSGMAA